jgi:hypothetical protein
MSIENILDSAFCKISDGKNNLHRWKNWEPNTPFAPVFDCPIWVEDLNTYFIESLIGDIEKNNPGSYQETWRTYNIFEWQTNSTKSLKDFVTRVYYDYVNSLSLPKERVNDVWIRGWAVVLEPGQPVPRHCHSYHENTFLSGNVMLTDNQTTTDYFLPHLSDYYGPWKCENKPGRITMFPSWINHEVLPTEQKRISVGFDLFSFHTLEYISKNRVKGDEQQECILKSIKLV